MSTPTNRLLAIMPHHLTDADKNIFVSHLINNGYESALGVSAKPEDLFIEENQAALNGEDNSRAIHRNAVDIRQRVNLWKANLKDTIAAPHFQALNVNNVHNDILDLTNFQSLFGPVNTQHCEHCESILSPAAYFADLMHLVQKYITDPSADKIPSGKKLMERRVDLATMPLDCEHTETLVPYLQIVNEAMEIMLRSAPDEDGLQLIAQEIYPFNLPFNSPLEQIRSYLAHFNLQLSDIMDMLTIDETERTKAQLGLSSETFALITTPDISIEALNLAYGVDTDAGQDLANLLQIENLIEKINYSLEEVNDLSSQSSFLGSFLTPALAFSNGVQDGEDANTILLSSFDRFHRFLRLASKVNWGLTDLDWILYSLGISTFDENAVQQISKVKMLEARLKVPLDQLSSYWFDLKFFDPGNTQQTGSFFDQIFNEPVAFFTNYEENDSNPYHPPYASKNPAFPDPTFPSTSLTISWDSQSTDAVSLQIRHRLLAALKVNDAELNLMVKSLAEARSIDLSAIPLTIENLSALYRISSLSDNVKLSIIEYFSLLELLNKAELSGIDDVIEFVKWVDFLKESKLSPDQLQYIILGSLSPSIDPGFATDDLEPFWDSLQKAVAPSLLNASFFSKNQLMLEQTSGLENIRNYINEQGLIQSGIVGDTEALTELLEKYRSLQQNNFYEHLGSFFNQSLPLVQASSELIAKIFGPTEYIPLFFDPSTKEAAFEFIQHLSQMLMLVKELKLSADVLKQMEAHPEWFDLQLSGGNIQFSLRDIPNIYQFQQFTKRVKGGEKSLLAYFEIPASNAAEQAAKAAAFAELNAWIPSEITSIQSQLELTHPFPDSVSVYQRFAKLLDTSKKIGANVQLLFQLSRVSALSATSDWAELKKSADDLLNILNANYETEQWEKVFGPIRDDLNENLRDALAGRLIFSLQSDLPEVQDQQSLYEYMLMDVKMSGCAKTSQLKQGLDSLQLYIHRCNMGLEEGTLSHIPATWWAWMSHYRVWEANRKVFLYPENYIDPSLRKLQTPLYQEFKDELLQGEVSEEKIADVFHNYLRKLEELSNLQIVDTYYTLVDKPLLGSQEHTVFLFAHTHTDSPEFYYRKVIIDPVTAEINQWEPWQKIDAGIQAKNLTAVYAFNRLFIFWVEHTTKSIQVPKKSAHRNNSHGNSSQTEKAEVVMATIKYAFQQSKLHWTPPQTLKGDLPISVSPDHLGIGEPDQFTDASDYLSEIRNVIHPDLNVEKGFWRRVYPIHLQATNEKAERIMILYGDLPRIPPNLPAVQVNSARTTKYEEQNHFNDMLYRAARMAENAAGQVAGWVTLVPAMFLSNDLLVEEEALLIREQATDRSFTLAISDSKLQEITTKNLFIDNYFAAPLGGDSIDEGSILGQLSHWPMDEGSSQVVEDQVGINDGQISGPTWVQIEGFNAPSPPGGGENPTTQSRAVINNDSGNSILPITDFNNPASDWEAFTFECWIKPDADNDRIGTLVALTAPSEDSNSSSITIYFAHTDEKEFRVNINGNHFQLIPQAIVDGLWHHVAFTFVRASKTLLSYQDGILVKTDTTSLNPPLSGFNKLYLGQNSDDYGDSEDFDRTGNVDPPETYKGKIAEIRLWNIARSGDQINETIRRKLSGSEGGLVGYWPLDEGSGDVIDDKTSNNNNTQSFQGESWELVNDFPFLEEADAVIEEENDDESDSDPRAVLQFERSQFVEVGSFKGAAMTEFTIECWVKSSQMGTILDLSFPDQSGHALTLTTATDDNGKLRLRIDGEGSGLINAAFNNGQWNHLVVTWRSQTGRIGVYKNGTELPIEVTLAQGRTIPTDGILRIGDNLDDTQDPSITGFGEGFIGQLAELRIWNVALSPTEILETIEGGGQVESVGFLLSNVSSLHGRSNGVKNMPGTFVFDNGNESFLVFSKNHRMAPIAHAMEFPSNKFDGHQTLVLQQSRENLFFSGPFSFFKLNAQSILQLSQRAFIGGPEQVLNLQSQHLAEIPFLQYGPNSIRVIAKSSDRMDFNGPFKDYFWEVFFHIPFLVAKTFNTHQNFAAAKKWMEFIFDPHGDVNETADDSSHAADRFWQFLPFRGHNLEKLNQMMNNPLEIKVYENDPFDPDGLARTRIGAYEKALVMAYIDNLIDWGDYLFAQDSWESITEATMLYILALDILGTRPKLIGDPSLVRLSKSYSQLTGTNMITQELLELEDKVLASGDSIQLPGLPFDPIETFNYFCVPENKEFLAYWDRVEDRLFKIRHCMNIEGVRRQLALFQPPIDPRQLIRLAASGQDILQLGSNLQAQVTPYRFTSLIQQAKEFTNTLIQLGDKLLITLEKKDAESLGLMRASFESTILKMTGKVKEKQVELAENQLQSLETAKSIAQARRDYYTNREFINSAEITHLALLGASGLANGIGQGFKLGSSIASLVPDTQEGLIGIEPTLLVRYGGSNFAKFADYIGDSLLILGTLLETGASMSVTIGAYQRRQEEWDFQAELAELDIQHINHQITIAKLQVDLATQELEVHNSSLEQSKEQEQYLKDKFTNKDLYQWMCGRIATVYFQSYKLAFNLAKEAEKSFQFERNLADTYIEFGYWDSLKKGLLSGEGLMISLQQLEHAYMNQHERKLEIEKTISLLQLNPLAFRDLKNDGQCTFELTEQLFDYDFPGHYNRQITSISISIPAIVGPYQNVQATLTQLRNQILLKPDASAVEYLISNTGDRPDSGTLRYNWRNNQQIAISKGAEDSGMFFLNFQDQRFLPFEGTGAVSEWKLEMPKASNRIDFDSISDVIIHLKYTATSGGQTFREEVINLDAMQTYQGWRFLSLRQEFSTDWHAFTKNQSLNEPETKLSFMLSEKLFPVNLVSNSLEIGYDGHQISLISLIEEGGSENLNLKLNDTPINNGMIQRLDIGTNLTISADKDPAKNLKDLILIMPFKGDLAW